MAVFDDVLTTEGQRFLMKMLSGETQNIRFTKLVLGDGNTSADLKTITAPVHAVAEVPIESVILSAQNDVTITAVFRNNDLEEGFYMREKAIFATDGVKEVLVLYANAGSLAEYIEPSTSEVYEKILRSILLFSQSDNVNLTVDDVGYTSTVDFHAHLSDYSNPHKVTKEQVGLGNIENKTINNQIPTFTESSNLVELSSGDTLSATIGKIAKAIKDFISHISLVGSSSVLGHIKIGTGISVTNGTASVKLTDSVNTTDSTTALSATGAKSINDSKAPNSHASTATTYGTGNTNNYGHVKLNDSFTISAGTAASGVGASSRAVFDSYEALKNAKAPNNHAVATSIYGLGDNANFGHVKLSDLFTYSAGAATSGVGASSKAVADAYNDLNNQIAETNSKNTIEVMMETEYSIASGSPIPTNSFDAVGGYKYIVSITVVFQANSSGKRKISIGNNAFTQTWGTISCPVNSSSKTTELSLTYVVRPNTDGKIYIWIEQDSGVGLTCRAGGYAIRIA